VKKTLFYGILAILAIFALTLSSCGGSNEEPTEEEPTPTAAPTPIPTPYPTPTPIPESEIISPPTGMAINPLTRGYISQEAAARRPFAVVYNNESRALPQAGLSQADIIYEVLAEGNITRIIAIFTDFNAEMIGPVRSSRHYFNNLALDFNAVLVHHGGSPQAYSAISNLGISNIDGMRYDGSVFWRDAARRRERGLEHSSFTSAENLLEIAESRGFLTDNVLAEIFDFFEEPTLLTLPNLPTFSNSPNENAALNIRVPFAGQYATVFEFDAESGMYLKYIFGNPHIDAITEEQIAVTNVIVQITGIRHIQGDSAGRRDVDLIGSGEGYLFSMGTFQPITWQKTSANSPTQWFDVNGNRLTVNQGTTWINIISGQPDFGESE